MMRFAWFGVFASLLLVGCGDGTTGDDGGAGDATIVDGACVGAADGTACGEGMVCVGEVCIAAGCGDGILSADEQCDDGNDAAFDGCDPDCTFTCEADAECDDGLSCNGSESCEATMHVCQPGTAAEPGVACTTPTVADGVCRSTAEGATCVDSGCGNGVVDGAEDCDDMNEVVGDGCEADCTFSCAADADCDDFLNCTGTETCDTDTHICQLGEMLDCTDGDDCTDDLCDDTVGGCFNPLIDADMDGHAATSLGACGTDCDDTRGDVFDGAEELCDGVDNNCNTDIDEIAPTWYVDCDADGFAASTDSSRMSCAAPPGSATGCGGTWVSRRPVDRTNTDCDDSNSDMYPGQTAYFTSAHDTSGSGNDERYGNYNCNGTAQLDHTTNLWDGSCDLYSGRSGTYACRDSGWVASSTPACGFSGTYNDCGTTVQECTLRCDSSYSLVCEGSRLLGGPCYCPPRVTCLPSCTPGSRGCVWHYYRCQPTARSGERMACR